MEPKYRHLEFLIADIKQLYRIPILHITSADVITYYVISRRPDLLPDRVVRAAAVGRARHEARSFNVAEGGVAAVLEEYLVERGVADLMESF